MSNNKVQLPVTINGKQLHVGDFIMTRWGRQVAVGFEDGYVNFNKGLGCELHDVKYIIDDDAIMETKAEGCTVHEEPLKKDGIEITFEILFEKNGVLNSKKFIGELGSDFLEFVSNSDVNLSKGYFISW